MSAWRLDRQLADDTHPVAQLLLSEVRLRDDSHHPWLVLVPRVAGAVELFDLSDGEQQSLVREIALAGRVLRDCFVPDKVNVGALGNLVPQLHVHVVARFRGDIAWPGPVWGHSAARPYTPEALVERINRLREALAST